MKKKEYFIKNDFVYKITGDVYSAYAFRWADDSKWLKCIASTARHRKIKDISYNVKFITSEELKQEMFLSDL